MSNRSLTLMLLITIEEEKRDCVRAVNGNFSVFFPFWDCFLIFKLLKTLWVGSGQRSRQSQRLKID